MIKLAPINTTRSRIKAMMRGLSFPFISKSKKPIPLEARKRLNKLIEESITLTLFDSLSEAEQSIREEIRGIKHKTNFTEEFEDDRHFYF